MTSAQVVETSVNVTPNSPSQDYTHPDDHNLRTCDMNPGFKPFTEKYRICNLGATGHPSNKVGSFIKLRHLSKFVFTVSQFARWPYSPL